MDTNERAAQLIMGEVPQQADGRACDVSYACQVVNIFDADDKPDAYIIWASTPEQLHGKVKKAEDPRCAFYLAPQSYKAVARIRSHKNYGRKEENIFHRASIAVDIDCHNNDDMEPTINAVAELLRSGSCEECKVPRPNIIVNTGRGVQAFWLLKFTYMYDLNWLIDKVEKDICGKLESEIKENPFTYEGAEVDTAASCKRNGLFRYPGTYNPKAKKMAEAEILSEDSWDINDLIEACAIVVKPAISEKPEKKKSKRTKRTERSSEKKETPFSYRKKILLETLKAEGAETIGRRHNILFIFAVDLAFVVDRNSENFEKEVYAINDVFSEPLDDQEIESIVQSVRAEERIYPVSHETYSKYTGIDIQKKTRDTNAARNKKNMEKKMERIEKMRRMYRRGRSISDIAKEMGCDRRTVKKYTEDWLKEIEEREAKEKLRKKYEKALNHIKSVRKDWGILAYNNCVNSKEAFDEMIKLDEIKIRLEEKNEESGMAEALEFFDVLKECGEIRRSEKSKAFWIRYNAMHKKLA